MTIIREFFFFKYFLYEVAKIYFLLLLVRDVAACVCMLKLLLFAQLMFLPPTPAAAGSISCRKNSKTYSRRV